MGIATRFPKQNLNHWYTTLDGIQSTACSRLKFTVWKTSPYTDQATTAGYLMVVSKTLLKDYYRQYKIPQWGPDPLDFFVCFYLLGPTCTFLVEMATVFLCFMYFTTLKKLTNKTNKTRNNRMAIPPICKFVLFSLINVVWLKPFMLITIKMSLVKMCPRKQVWWISDSVMRRHFDEPSWSLVNNVFAS